MPQRLRQIFKFKDFSLPVSYSDDEKGKMREALNVYTNKGRLDTRFGCHRFNSTALSGDVQSVTFFKKTDETSHILAKHGVNFSSVSESSSHTSLSTSLSTSTRHRAVTFTDRSIIALGSDGVYSFNGTTFTQLGQDASTTAVSVAASGAGNTLPASDYKVAFTFYASSIGFESNLSTESATVTVASGEQIDVTAIPTSADNALVDKKRIYIKDVTADGEWFFWSEINLAVSTETIDGEITSTSNPPTKNARPIGSGAEFVEKFGERLVLAGVIGFESDVLFSEPYLPDAFDDGSSTRLVFKAGGDGPITGIKVGYYTNDNLNPYLCVFKRKSVEVYSELGGNASYSTISTVVGAVSQDTIVEKDGDVYFMSESGWHVISSGKLVESKGLAAKLGGSDLDSIFTDDGFIHELNQEESTNFFSVYYQRLDQYITFVSEAGSSVKNRAYNYEYGIKGFRPYEFPVGFSDACIFQTSNEDSLVLLAGEDGYIYKHGIGVSKYDQTASDDSVIIAAFAQLYWINHEDFDSTLNFGQLILKSLNSSNDLTVKYWLNYNLSSETNLTYSFTGSSSGFILDESKLDEGIFGDGREVVRSVGRGIYKTAQCVLVGFYQSVLNGNIALISGQIDASKNGNVN